MWWFWYDFKVKVSVSWGSFAFFSVLDIKFLFAAKHTILWKKLIIQEIIYLSSNWFHRHRQGISCVINRTCKMPLLHSLFSWISYVHGTWGLAIKLFIYLMLDAYFISVVIIVGSLFIPYIFVFLSIFLFYGNFHCLTTQRSEKF